MKKNQVVVVKVMMAEQPKSQDKPSNKSTKWKSFI
jgi:hypothetical protein